MPVKRGADTPPRARKRPRVPKFNEGSDEAVARPDQEDENEEDPEDEVIEEEGGYYVEDIYIPPKLSLTERPQRGERLIIEKIECENFKSYGGIKVMGPFHKSFSAIIGPNGNGKSNIIDAMLFVFGYRAKKIRCKKVSVLIHKSELLKNVGSCAVTVHFLKIVDDKDADDNELNIVPNSRITVCRRAYTNNTSCYWLNSKRVQFTEVAKFLKESGIDIVHNRFLILQGEVEQIAQMPPKASNTHETGFLEFIDEVIGTKRYEKALYQLKEKINVLEIAREEKSQRVTLAQQHKEGMKEPMEKAKIYLNNKNVMTRTNHTLNQVKAYKYRQRFVEKSEKLKEMETDRSAILTRLDEIKQYNEEKRQEYVTAEKSFKAAEKLFQEKKKAFDEADGKFTALNREIKTSNEERKSKIKELEKATSDLEKLVGLPERHAVEIEKLETRKLELDSDIQKEEESTKGDLERLNVEVDACATEKKKADLEFRQLKTLMDKKQTERNTLQKELERGKANEAKEQEKLQKLEEELDKLREQVRRKSGEAVNVQPDIIPKKEVEARRKREQALALVNEEHEKRATFNKLRSQYGAAKDSMDDGAITDQVDKALFAAKSQGMFPGLYGRFKDLATIDEKYNIAATVATGMLNYWIVDNDATGAECIQFLKDKRLTAQTFVCVNKMNKDFHRRPFRTPQDSLRIYDLLKISKPELQPVYYKGFYDTLVAENIDIASKVAYGGSQRHRVVTCQGDVIETTGSLVGGGRRPDRGQFNTEMSKRLNKNPMSRRQIEELKVQCEAAERELTEVSDRRKTLEEEASNLDKEIQEIKAKLNTYQSDLDAARRMIPLKEKLIKDQEQKVKESAIPKNVLKEKEKEIEKIDAEIEEAKEPYEEAEENAKQLEAKMKTLQQDKRKEILKKLTKLTDQRKRVVEELKKLNVELRNCEKNRLKFETKISKLNEDKQALETKMRTMLEEKKQLTDIAAEIREQQGPLEEDRNEKEKIYTELKTKASEFDQEEKKLNKQKVTVDNNFQTLSDEVRSLEKHEKVLIASLDKLKLEEIPEVEVDPFQMLTEEQLNEANEKELEARLHKYQQKLAKVEPNLNILPEYANACKMLLERFEELESVNQRRETVNNGYLELEARRMKEFMEGYAAISAKVKELFRMISMGGDAELDLLDSTDPFSCGIDFSVRPRGKTWKKIINLSGGEKTLSSLALVFSLHHFKPSPFYVMDEIDAALDFQNVSIIANYIKDRTKFTQFIIISLRSNMFELADSLLGVYKVDNMSYSIRLGVTNVVNVLKGCYEANGRPFLLGQDDQGTVSSTPSTRRPQITATTIASTQSSQPMPVSQATTVGIGAASDKRPSLDVSAIREADVSCAETERASGDGSRPPSAQTDYNPGPSTIGPGSSTEEADSGTQRRQVVVETPEMEQCESPDFFGNSFEEDKELAAPKYQSTPLVTSPPKRLRTQGNLPEVEEEEDSSDVEMDAESADEFFNSLNSANNSQQMDS